MARIGEHERFVVVNECRLQKQLERYYRRIGGWREKLGTIAEPSGSIKAGRTILPDDVLNCSFWDWHCEVGSRDGAPSY